MSGSPCFRPPKRIAEISTVIAGLEVISRRAAAPGNKPPLLFIHGAFAAAWCWDEFFLGWFAARGYDAHAVSLRGHGNSAGREGLDDSSIADYVDDVQEIAESFSERPLLIGHSMGGFVVQKYLEREHPAGAVLMASVPPRGLAGPGLSLAIWNPMAALSFGSGQPVGQGWGAPDVMHDTLFSSTLAAGKALDYLARMGPESTRAMLDMYGADLPDIGRAAACPMLVMGAGEDELIPGAFVRATARSYDAHLQVLDGVGHVMMLDAAWESVAECLLDWMRQNGF
jgi:pimeloyl-ACP methyl ester carboxylesterase